MATAIGLSGSYVCFPQLVATKPPLRSPSSSIAARTLSSSSCASFTGVSIAPTRNTGLALTTRGTVLKVRAGKAALACTKRSRSRLSRARASGFRVRLRTPGGRNVLRRRRAKGRKILCPSSNPYSGKRA